MKATPPSEDAIEDAIIIVVDRGQPVILTIEFEEDPESVYFTYLKPGSERPYADDGFGQPRSLITRLGDGVYGYTISTEDFAGGVGYFHFWGEWTSPSRQRRYTSAHIRRGYRVRVSKAQLL